MLNSSHGDYQLKKCRCKNHSILSINSKTHKHYTCCKGCRDRNTESSRKRRHLNPELKRIQNRTYDLRHSDKRKKQSESYYLRTAESHKKLMKLWRKNNREKCLIYSHNRRARVKNAKGKILLKEWLDLKEKYKNICLCCKQKIKLTIDHVIPLIKGGENTILNVQPLCSPCNFKKGRKIIDYR